VIAAWHRFVAACAAREDPLALAVVRVALASVVLYDLAWVAALGLPPLIWLPPEVGGTVDLRALQSAPSFVHVLPSDWAIVAGLPIAWGLLILLVLSAASFGVGLFTRWSGLIFVLSYAQTQMLNDTADRGIDRLIRIAVLVLVCSPAGARLSLDAWRRTGSWLGDPAPRLAWARYFLVFQLTLVYVAAGMEKFAFEWFPWGGATALFMILQDPQLAVMDFEWVQAPLPMALTRLGTSGSHLWEWTFFLMPVALWFQATRTRPGRLRASFNAWDVRMIYVVVGVIFHLALAGTLRLGVFPAAMLALYPIFFAPQEIAAAARWGRRFSGFGGRSRAAG